MRGSHVGTYLPSSGIWHHTQRFLKKGASNPKTINHLDFDAPTREHAQQLPDDKVFSCKYIGLNYLHMSRILSPWIFLFDRKISLDVEILEDLVSSFELYM